MTTKATAMVVISDDGEQRGFDRAMKDSDEEVGGDGGGGSGSRSSCSDSDTPPSLSPSSSLLPISISSTSGDEKRTLSTREAGYEVGNSSCAPATATATTLSATADRAELFTQSTMMSTETETPPPTTTTETTIEDSTTQMLEARIVQLEQTLRVLVTTLQQQQLQLNSQNQMPQQQDGQHQQLDDGNDHKPGHTREGSDVSSSPIIYALYDKKYGGEGGLVATLILSSIPPGISSLFRSIDF